VSAKTNFLIYHPTGDKQEEYIFDGQRPSLQQKCAVLGLFFKLASVVAGVDRLKTAFNQKNQKNRERHLHIELENKLQLIYNVKNNILRN